MTFLTDDQLSAHLQAWLDEPAQKALKAEGGDAVEMMHYDVTTSEQIRFLHAFNVFWDQATVPVEPEHDLVRMRSLHHALTAAKPLIYNWYDDGLSDEQYENRLRSLFNGVLGDHCGLNADWSGMAWMLSKGKPNATDRALYFLWADDGDFAIVRRFLDEGEADQGVEDLFFGKDNGFIDALDDLIMQIEGAQ